MPISLEVEASDQGTRSSVHLGVNSILQTTASAACNRILTIDAVCRITPEIVWKQEKLESFEDVLPILGVSELDLKLSALHDNMRGSDPNLLQLSLLALATDSPQTTNPAQTAHSPDTLAWHLQTQSHLFDTTTCRYTSAGPCLSDHPSPDATRDRS